MRKVDKVFVERGWIVPKQRLQIFTDSFEKILTDCHDRHPPPGQLNEIKTLKTKSEATRTVIRKTDKFKVFHLGRQDDYRVEAQAYMTKTKAYQELGTINPLESLVERTNDLLLKLLVNKYITQRQYEK